MILGEENELLDDILIFWIAPVYRLYMYQSITSTTVLQYVVLQ